MEEKEEKVGKDNNMERETVKVANIRAVLLNLFSTKPKVKAMGRWDSNMPSVPTSCTRKYVCLLFAGWLLNVPATCECISGTDLLRQLYVLPH